MLREKGVRSENVRVGNITSKLSSRNGRHEEVYIAARAFYMPVEVAGKTVCCCRAERRLEDCRIGEIVFHARTSHRIRWNVWSVGWNACFANWRGSCFSEPSILSNRPNAPMPSTGRTERFARTADRFARWTLAWAPFGIDDGGIDRTTVSS